MFKIRTGQQFWSLMNAYTNLAFEPVLPVELF
jgi:hypothetical protein